MLTKKTTSKTRMAKYAAVVLALVAVLVFCLASCGSATPTAAEYVAGSATKTEYNQGEVFDCTGAQIKVTYDNGEVATVDVTKEMVGSAPLTLNTTSVSVTYTENGKTVIVNIPVTVKDPYAAEKETAIAGLYSNAAVQANATDKGVSALIDTYIAKINAAVDEDAIGLNASEFVTKLEAYLEEKADILSEVVYDSTKVLDLYKPQADSAKETAITGIKAASSIKEANALLDNFKTTIANILKEQALHEGDKVDQGGSNVGTEGGMINDKIAILKEINYYIAKTQHYRELLAASKAEVSDYDTIDTQYKDAINDLEWWYEYVTLAIDLGGVWDRIENEIVEDVLATPIDDIADLLVEGVTVYPISYKTNADVTGDFLDEIAAKIKATEDKFGHTMTAALINGYGKFNDVDLAKEISFDANDNGVIDQDEKGNIELKYDELTAKRDLAVSMNVIAKIDAIWTAAEGADRQAAINEAWAALEAWGEEATLPALFIQDSADPFLTIAFDKTFAGVFSVTLSDDGKWFKDGEWSAYDLTKDYTIEYFVPNLADLFEATIQQSVYDTKVTVNAIGKVILSGDATIDKSAEIVAAEAALVAFKDRYGEEEYAKRFVVDGVNETENTVKAAREQYTKLETLAATANEKIAAMKAEKATAADIVLSDGTKADGLLNVAYAAYCAFAKENTDENGVIHTDVITDEAYMFECMDAYVALAFNETKSVYVSDTIHEAQKTRVGNGETTTGDIALDNSAFRKAVTECADEMIASIGATAYDKSAETKINRLDVLQSNKTGLINAADDAAAAIVAATNASELPTP